MNKSISSRDPSVNGEINESGSSLIHSTSAGIVGQDIKKMSVVLIVGLQPMVSWTNGQPPFFLSGDGELSTLVSLLLRSTLAGEQFPKDYYGQ